MWAHGAHLGFLEHSARGWWRLGECGPVGSPLGSHPCCPGLLCRPETRRGEEQAGPRSSNMLYSPLHMLHPKELEALPSQP